MKALQLIVSVTVFFSIGAAVVNPLWLLVTVAAVAVAVVISG
jgi:hypothetical protein